MRMLSAGIPLGLHVICLRASKLLILMANNPARC
jgi:hypothetical protein